LIPTESAWESGDRRGYCLAVNEEVTPFSGSVASLWTAQWTPLYWVDAALVAALIGTYVGCALALRRSPSDGSLIAAWKRELWWFVLPVGGAIFALVFPGGTRAGSTQAALPFPITLTIAVSMTALAATGSLATRALSLLRLAAAKRAHPGSLVLEGVRLPLTLARLRTLTGAGRRLTMKFWFPLIVTRHGLSIPAKHGELIVLKRENIRNVDSATTSVGDGAGGTRSASLIEVRLIDPDLVVPIAIRSARWNAFIRLTADATETAAASKALSEQFETTAT
jgi:hypothetical protein